ncbi:hypothetical protein OZX74_00880 [Bifidobacterium sp. ESL0798]|uniref:hypothetical protein n=1 Tax=Bifidobacterium sp. ESL0798 TaxID=2983235 RepID=UPI0023F6A0D1|nr:hypothetical protein [Bifidobacterium sp. ESL0798]WEV74153.1 hypothetical protein OZX74_00880 [Bifidobacterium sp. ESL0798]
MNMAAMDKSISQFRGLAKVCDTYSDSYKVVDKEGSGQSIDAAHGDDKAFHDLARQMKALFSGTADFFERAKKSYKQSDDKAAWQFRG